MDKAIDWNVPLEAKRTENGPWEKVASCHMVPCNEYRIEFADGAHIYVRHDGNDVMGSGNRRVRNRTEQPAPQYPPELVERMVAHIRTVCAKYEHVKASSPLHNEELIEARAILADLPQPVDPDLELARECAGDAHGLDGSRPYYEGGHYDGELQVKAALAAIKRVREEQHND